MSREDRRLLNIKQDSINEIDYYPSSQNVPEGDMIISHPKGKSLRLYKRVCYGGMILLKTEIKPLKRI